MCTYAWIRGVGPAQPANLLADCSKLLLSGLIRHSASRDLIGHPEAFAYWNFLWGQSINGNAPALHAGKNLWVRSPLSPPIIAYNH